ncbi:MAG: membrane protein insertase YidC [Muribaculaceae bacterium]|nr:membrane protein insertase YidC [Muribaculaceae bacterium]MBR1551952.1 membrane protein insertase YidC [Muribaculaceae bacterium]
MDKNSITGMLLMCAVIFGFMWLNKPSEAQLAEQRRIQDSIAQVEAQAQKLDATQGDVDTLTTTEVAQLREIMAAMPAESQKIENNEVKLALTDGQLTGTIVAGDTTVNIDEATANTSANPKAHNLAVAAVKRALEVYAKNGSFAGALSGTEQIIKLENDSLAIELSTKGGIISRASLKGYKAFNAPQVEVFTPGENMYGFTLSNNSQRFDTRNFFFTPRQINDSTVLMQIDLGNGASWGLQYTLVPGSYMVRMQMVQQGMTQVIPLNINTVDFDWTQKMSRHEEGKMFEERNSAIYYKYSGASGDVEYTKENGDDDKEIKDKLKWISTKNQFFSAVLIADSVMSGAQLTSREIQKETPDYEKYLKQLTIHTTMPYASDKAQPASFYFYLGPNRYKVLSSYDKYSPAEDLKLTRLIPLGWKLFRWINTGVIIPVFNWLGTFLSNYGIIILILTIIIKLVLSPLTYKTYISQAKMRFLKPDIEAINAKYPNQEDAIKRQQKTMELYSQAGASPFGGCLPMLLQMPILIAMFTFFPSCIELRGQSFLWAQDLSAPDKIVSWTGQIPFITNYFGNHISLFCLLMTATNIIYTWLTMQSQQSSQQMPGMKWMMYLMPLMFLVFFNNYASGLSYYYFISLLITIAQTYSSRLLVSEEKVRATIAANRAKPKKKSGFMARLEEAQRQQQEALRQQQKKGGKRR